MTHPPSPRRRGLPLWGIALIAVIVLPIVLLIAGFTAFQAKNRAEVRKLEAAVKQRGEPLTLAELESRRAPVPDEENAALALIQIWEEEDPAFWQAFRAGARPLPTRNDQRTDPPVPFLGKGKAPERAQPLSEETRRAAEEFLREQRSHLEAVREALKRSRSRYPLDFTEGQWMHLAHLSEVKRESQMFRLASLVAAEQGDTATAISSLQTIVQLGNTLTNDSLLISHLVRNACMAIAIDGVQDLVGRQVLSSADLDQVRILVDGINFEGCLKETMIAERAFALSVFELTPEQLRRLGSQENGFEEPAPGAGYTIARGFFEASGLASLDRQFMLNYFAEMISAADGEPVGSLRKAKELEQRLDKEGRKFPPKVFSTLYLPPLKRAAQKFAAIEARRRAALVSLAVLQHRSEHAGVTPVSLSELKDQDLVKRAADPFDGQPLRFKKRESGFAVYSVGADLSDDGGKERSKRSTQSGFDETFIVER